MDQCPRGFGISKKNKFLKSEMDYNESTISFQFYMDSFVEDPWKDLIRNKNINIENKIEESKNDFVKPE